MTTRRSWWSNNFTKAIWTIVFSIATTIFVFGGGWEKLESLPNHEAVRGIVQSEIKEKCYSKTNGKILENNLNHIRKQLTRMENQTGEIKKLIEMIHPPN